MLSKPTRNLALELVRVTEAAALAAGRYMGRGDKNAVDQAAVTAMRLVLKTVQMDGTVVIGEGEKDSAPLLFCGERVGTGEPPEVDIAVDPVDGTTPFHGKPECDLCDCARSSWNYVQPGSVHVHGQDCGRARSAWKDRHQCPSC